MYCLFLEISQGTILHFQGDSGGPLNCPIDNPSDYEGIGVKTKVNLSVDDKSNFAVCGITSFGKKDKWTGLELCGTTTGKTYPVYTNVGYYTEWIKEATGKYLFNIHQFLSFLPKLS